jgi:iron complex outermembrane receptor protein
MVKEEAVNCSVKFAKVLDEDTLMKPGEGHSVLTLLITLLLFFLPLCALAEEHPTQSPTAYTEEMALFQEIPSVYGASRYEQKVTEAPASVTIVTADEIKKYGYKTLADILRSVRSFYITYDRNYNYVGVRGFGRPGDYNTRILLLVDGHRINDNIYDTAAVGTEFIIDVDLIDRVEVIRGPGSSLYGNNAFFAVVNVITKSGRDLKTLEVSGDAGSFNTYKGRLSYGNRFQNGVEALVSGTAYYSSGPGSLYFNEFDDPSTNNGTTQHTDYDRSLNGFAKFSFHDFSLEGAYITRTKGIPTASFGTDFNNRGNETTDAHGYLDLKYETALGPQWDLTARLYYDSLKYQGYYLYSGVVNKDTSNGNWWGAEAKVMTRVLDKNKIIVGVEYQGNFKQDQKNYDMDPFFSYLDDARNSTLWAVYAQDEFSILKNLTLTAGVRYDHYSTFGGTTNPRLALVYSPSEKTIFKALYGTAFRAPNVYEIYYETSGVNKANPDLKPETIKTYELVYEQYIGNYLRGSISGFYYTIQDLITQTVDPVDNVLVFTNTDKVEAKGIEFELDGKLPGGFEGRISYSIQNAKNKATGETLTNSPAQLAKFNLIAPLVKQKLFAGLEVQYTSKRKTLAGNYVDGFSVTNLTLFSQNLLKGLEISGSVYNLFNKKYGDPGAEEHVQDILQQDGRTFRVKVTYAF